MKKVYLVLIFTLLLLTSVQSMAKCTNTLYKKICVRIADSNKHVEPGHLADKIALYAYKHGLNPYLFAAIIRNESNFRLGAINSRTHDYGLTQINQRNIDSLKLDKGRLLTDVDYALEHGAAILAFFKRTYGKKEPQNWFCRYNAGTAKFNYTVDGQGSYLDKRLKNCLNYKQKVDKHLAFMEN